MKITVYIIMIILNLIHWMNITNEDSAELGNISVGLLMQIKFLFAKSLLL